jgi:hypothetical protein
VPGQTDQRHVAPQPHLTYTSRKEELVSQDRNTVSAYEATTHLSELSEKVQGEPGDRNHQARHGVAPLVPMEKKASADERVAAIERIQKLPAYPWAD